MRLRWALRNLARHPLRTALVTMGIAVAAALLLDMVMLQGGMDQSFEKMLLSRGFQMRISPKGTLPFDTEATLPGVTALVRDLRADPSVAAAGAVVGTSIYGTRRDERRSLLGYGFDPEGQGLYEVLRGSELQAGDSIGLLIGDPVARATGWQLGDTVQVESPIDPQLGHPLVERPMIIRGVVRWLFDSKDELTVGADYRVMQRFEGLDSIDGAALIMLKVKDGRNVDSLAVALGERHPTIEVHSVAELVAQFRTRLVYFQQLALILAAISLIVAIMLVGIILTISISERLGELMVLRAIGVTRFRLVRSIILESTLVTFAGSAAGMGLGLLTARYLDAILTSFPGLPAAISFFVAEPSAVVRAMGTLIVAGIVAAAYPAWIASRAPIAATLRAEAE